MEWNWKQELALLMAKIWYAGFLNFGPSCSFVGARTSQPIVFFVKARIRAINRLGEGFGD